MNTNLNSLGIIPDVIGLIPDVLPTFNEDGSVATEGTFLEGWHVNFPEEVEGLEEFLLSPQPTTPYRVYAGNIMHVAYKFPDEETFKQFFPDE